MHFIIYPSKLSRLPKRYLDFIIYPFILFLIILLSPVKSDFYNYQNYYNTTNFSNFLNFSFGVGWLFYVSLFSSIGLPFFWFWKLTNAFCCISFYYFLLPKSNKFSISFIIFLLLLFFLPLSFNVFNNIIRHTLSIAICFLLIKRSSPPLLFILPVCFHVASIVVVIAYFLDSHFRVTRYYSLYLFSLVILPFFAPLLRSSISLVLDNLYFLRSVRNILIDDYTPSFRYLAFILFSLNVLLVLFLYLIRRRSHYSFFPSTRNSFEIEYPHISFLCSWFSISLLLYWSLYGLGASVRILTHPVWISIYFISVLLTRLFFSFFQSKSLTQ